MRIFQAIALAHGAGCSAKHKHKRKRRAVERASGAWAGSTLHGYLNGDEITHRENFRMTSATLDALCALLEPTALRSRVGAVASKQPKAPLRFKVAACLYLMAQGASVKCTADVGSVGKSTMRDWLHKFVKGVNKEVKAVYMPSKPPSPEHLESVRAQFAVRRGIPNVAMAVDGSHVPFRPDKDVDSNDYKNYKGWMSILAVAFVNSFYLFVDAHVGYG
jgi:hypothetical protein